ncbi:GNAT family N-acetyltransferase [Sebaldella sp. S0638]|uniref:GNAT family N-acetyltransferase n=1 Tax=Sebaldella sp. S0638 TaxID=2957809 RepID=UPI00209E14E2|nr:GNAT family protein [Sebaldella sp. S0638]MCP1223379.1 GNAT family N-acetyltransferase [Sebaldella sp. S0638]
MAEFYKKIIGERCYLSPISMEDVPKYTNWLNDFEVVMSTTLYSRIVDVEAESEALAELKKGYHFAIRLNQTNELIGNIGLNDVDFLNRNAELGIIIGNKTYWKQGYGKESIELLLDFTFNILNMKNVYLKVFEFNAPGIKLYEKTGFKMAGRLRKALEINGNRYDLIFMDILAEEYRSVYVDKVFTKRFGVGKE